MMSVRILIQLTVSVERPLDRLYNIPLVSDSGVMEQISNKFIRIFNCGHLQVRYTRITSSPNISEFFLEFGSSVSHGLFVCGNLFSFLSLSFSLSCFMCLFSGKLSFLESCSLLLKCSIMFLLRSFSSSFKFFLTFLLGCLSISHILGCLFLGCLSHFLPVSCLLLSFFSFSSSFFGFLFSDLSLSFSSLDFILKSCLCL